jgi:very-short-patch-repair endonuclease
MDELKGAKLDGKKFRRQHGIGPYIADFYCPESRLIVELDGAVHEDVLRMERDTRRMLFFEKLGIRVIRFENKLVFEDIELVLNAIRAAIAP